jgi:Skp family chaperone for outer membrane proteins
MRRKYALAVGAVVAVTAAFVSGAKPPAEKKPAGTVAVFNVAAVMRDFHQAKYQVWLLNKKRETLSKDMIGWRKEYIELQQEASVRGQKESQVEKVSQKLMALARKIEDADRKINKQLNDDASAIIADLYDKIKEVVDETAKQEGFKLVFAHPDAVTAEELKSPYIKELKLKPPAAQPFYIAADVDLTAGLIKTLNDRHPAIDAETKKPVDVSKLEMPAPPPVAPAPLPPVPTPKP